MEEKEPICPPESKQPETFSRRALAFIGIEYNMEHMFHVALKRRFFLILLGLPVLFMVLISGLAVYSNQPSFCNSCHIMEPYYKAWKTSNHNFVSCVECHYPPGQPQEIIWHKFQAVSQVVKYVTRTYSSKPFAEIDDSSCLRAGCHSTRLLQGQVVNKKNGIFFDHTPHLTQQRYGQQLRCVSCHSQIVIGTHMEVTWDTCYLCHLLGRSGENEKNHKPMGGCLGCHLLPEEKIKTGNVEFLHKDFIKQGQENCQSCHRAFMKGDGLVSKYRCFNCHNQPEKLARFKDTDFLHENHVTRHHTACFRCHEEIHHGGTIPQPVQDMTMECSRCHSNSHDLETDLYRGSGAKGVPEMPSPMYQAGVDCAACHIQKKMESGSVSQEASYLGSPMGCSNCHGPLYPEMVSEADQMVKDTTDRLDKKFIAVQGALEGSTLPQDMARKIKEKLDEAQDNLNFAGRVHSPHNIYYLAGVLSYTETVLTAAAKRLNLGKVEKTSDLPLISGAYCAQLCHNKLGVQVPPEGLKYQGRPVNHQRHLKEGMSCRTCHDFGVHREVKFKGEEVCKRCHSEEQFQEMQGK